MAIAVPKRPRTSAALSGLPLSSRSLTARKSPRALAAATITRGTGTVWRHRERLRRRRRANHDVGKTIAGDVGEERIATGAWVAFAFAFAGGVADQQATADFAVVDADAVGVAAVVGAARVDAVFADADVVGDDAGVLGVAGSVEQGHLAEDATTKDDENDGNSGEQQHQMLHGAPPTSDTTDKTTPVTSRAPPAT